MRPFASLLLAAALGAQAPPPQPSEPAIIQGRVTDSATGQPVPKATITFMVRGRLQNRPGAAAGGQTNRVFASGTDGTFRGTLPAGSYAAMVERNGFVPVDAAHIFNFTSGDANAPVELKLQRQGVITGRIVDEDGEPMDRVNVTCLAWTRSPQLGERVLVQRQTAMTNDLGEYRLYGLNPGRYFILAHTQPGGSRVRSSPQRVYPRTYFPGVTDLSGAQQIEVAAAGSRAGVDLRLVKVNAVTVRGQVTGVDPAATGLRRAGGNVWLQAADRSAFGVQLHSTPIRPNGDFELPNVTSGSYILHAMAPGGKGVRSGRLVLSVGDRDVSNLTVQLEPVFELPVTLQADDPSLFKNVMFQLYPLEQGAASNAAGRTEQDGKIVIRNLQKAGYRVFVGNLPAGYYLKTLQLGSLTSTRVLDLTAGAPGELTAIFEAGTAELTGQVLRSGEPVPNVQVMAVSGRDVVAETRSDATGRYTLRELPPGDYRLVTTTNPDLADPDTIDRLAASAERVSLAKSARETRQIDLR